MNTIGAVEDCAYDIERFRIDFMLDGRNVRRDKQVLFDWPFNKKTMGTMTVAHFIEKVEALHTGFSVVVLLGNGSQAPGRMTLDNVRKTY